MIKLSVVCATIDDSLLVNRMLASLGTAAAKVRGHLDLETVLVDQNRTPREEALNVPSNVQLVYIWSDTRGLSVNRNLGLCAATGQWVMCTDADCEIDPDFFSRLLGLMSEFPISSVFVGRILATETGASIFRKWPKKADTLSTYKVWQLATSVNCILKRNPEHRFDEQFGIGAKFGSCEDIDYVLRMEGEKFYSPSLMVFHPYQDTMHIPIEKTASYSFGFGALCKKHTYPFGLFYLVTSLLKKILDFVRRKVSFEMLVVTAKSRIKGYCEFSSTNPRPYEPDVLSVKN